MRLSYFTSYLTLLCAVQALSVSKSENALNVRDNLDTRSTPADFFSRLEKRKGGGRGGGSGGGSSSSSGGSSGGRGGGGRASSPGASYNAQPNSNVGGRTSTGTGVSPKFGAGGTRYGGGAQVPYKSGDRKGSVAPVLLGVGAMALIFPGIWLYGVYSYHFDRPYHFYNRSYVNDTVNGANQTLPVVCLCEQYVSCGCEENSDQAYINDLIGNGSYSALNKSVVNVAKDTDGVTKLFVNGTLANGTTAAGGEDSAAISLKVLQFSGWWVVIAMTVYAVCVL